MKKRKLARRHCDNPFCAKLYCTAMGGSVVIDGIEFNVCITCWSKST